MKKTLITLLAILGLISSSCKNRYNTSSDGSVKIMYETKTELPDSFKKIIAETIGNYRKIYGVPNYKEIIIRDSITSKSDTSWGARGGYQKIILNQVIFSWFNHALPGQVFRDIIVHELFHTLRPEYVTEVTPFKFDTTCLTIVSYHGLAPNFFKVKRLAYIEEGAADVIASGVYSNYGTRADAYNRSGSLMLSILNAKWISKKQLIEATSNNDLPMVVGMVIKKEKARVTNDDIIFVIKCFDDMVAKGDLIAELERIAERRGEKGKYKFSL